MGQRSAQLTIGNIASQSLTPGEIKTRWRDIFEVDAKDPALKARIEGTLDHLEKTKVTYTLNDAQGRMAGLGQVSGQDLFTRIAQLKNRYDRDGITAELTKQGFLPHGKFLIRETDVSYDGTSRTAPVTGVRKGTSDPATILMPSDYLKGAQLRQQDGTFRPLTIDQAVIHELGHFAFQTGNETQPNNIANVFVRSMGGTASGDLIYKKNSNVTAANPSGYVTLYDKVSGIKPRADAGQEFDLNKEALTPALLASAEIASGPAFSPMKPR